MSKKVIMVRGTSIPTIENEIKERAARARADGYKAGITRDKYEGHGRPSCRALFIYTKPSDPNGWKRY
jgi:hypothetical protein